VDRRYYLVGDEDGGVGLYCRTCDHGGRPLAYYISGYPDGHPDPAVPSTRSVDELLSHRIRHDPEHPDDKEG